MGVVERIMAHADHLTATERKIAEVLASEPQTVAFGTVAQVAQRAGTSGPSVVRLAVKLGYDGFVGLQADVQAELARQLGPARDRIRQRPPSDLLTRVQAAEQDNILRTLHGVTAALNRSIIRLADRHHRVWVLSAEMTAPVGMVPASSRATPWWPSISGATSDRWWR
jgi:DNA-binding MurR/RpiR family transcriptional regulator